MLVAGDELGRSQQGNNNAYCQDNPISWLKWELKQPERELLEFTQRIISLRKAHPLFRRNYFFKGRPIRGGEVKDIIWLNPDGAEISDEDWNQAFSRCLGVYYAGGKMIETDERGKLLKDDNLLLLLNAHHEDIAFMLPEYEAQHTWDVLLDTKNAIGTPDITRYQAGQTYPLSARALVLLKQAQPI
jgi:glycogen operon protein